MLTQPVGKLALADATGGEIKHEVFLIIHPGVDLRAIENEKRLHGRMPHPLVAVDERMAQYERETERCRLLDQRGIQVGATEGSFRLGYSRFQCAKTANAWSARANRRPLPA